MVSESMKDSFPQCVSGKEGSGGGPVYLDMNYTSPFVPEIEDEIYEMISVLVEPDENDLDLVAVELDDHQYAEWLTWVLTIQHSLYSAI